MLVTVAVTLACAAVAVVANRRFYFYDDTQIGAFGTWYELGDSLRHGRWPMLDPSRWMGGNVAAEGQWGVWNPVVLLIGLGASFASNALIYSTVVKVVLLVVAAVGTHRLVRDRGVPEPMCAVAGVAVALGGFTVYMDSPSWVTGLMTWALLPWAWSSLSRLARRESGIAVAFLTSYLIVTVGYVHGTLMLALVYVAVIVGALLDGRSKRDVLGVLGCGVLTSLVCITVYLPSLLTADVTIRAQRGITNSDFLSTDVAGLIASPLPHALTILPGWWPTGYAPAPIVYVAWFLPVLAFVDWSRARHLLRRHVDLLIVLAVAGALVLGPSDIGPLRFPVRLMPYVSLSAVAAVVVVLTAASARPVTRSRFLLAVAWVLVASFLTWSGRPPTWEMLGLSAVLVIAALAATRRTLDGEPIDWRRVAVVMLGATAAFSTLQRATNDSSPLPDFGLPPQVDAYRTAPPARVNDVVVVGSASAHLGDPALWREALLGNIWYVPDASVQNVYTPVAFARYSDLMCMNWRGETCPDLVNRLFAVQPATGLLLVDQLSTDTIVMFKDEVGDAVWSAPPPGWQLANVATYTASWVRTEPVGPAGGLVHASDGVQLTELRRSETEVSFRVDAVPSSGGQAVLSRLAWPGYKVQGAQLLEPTDGYLVTVGVPAGSEGATITVRFRPPGWRTELAAFALAMMGCGAWIIADAWRGRLRRGDPVPSGNDPPAAI